MPNKNDTTIDLPAAVNNLGLSQGVAVGPWAAGGETSAWSAEVQQNLRAFHTAVSAPWLETMQLGQAMLAGRVPTNIGLLLRAYLRGIGSYYDANRFSLRRITDEIGRSQRLLPPQGSFFEQSWAVEVRFVEEYCPDLVQEQFKVRSNADLEAVQLLESCPNEAMYLRLPASLGALIRAPRRPPFDVYATDDAVAYIHPFQYQVMTKDRAATWASASPRSLSRPSIPDLTVEETDKNIVIVQDRFSFENLCHFLYDGVTRILHYIENFGSSGDDLFVLGGIPHEYHGLVCAALSEHTGIREESLVFPTSAHLLATTRKCFWFSDQVERHSPPAQMAHPRSISLLALLGAKLPAASSTARRIYVSRADAGVRRVANEDELVAALKGRGFVSVQLSRLPAPEQIGLFRQADIVVGPHGQGLTHIIMGTRLGRVIELFHPRAGIASYAFIARSAGMEYDFVIGTPVPDTRHSDFTVDVDRVLDLLGADQAPAPRPAWHKNANLIPSSRNFQDFFPAKHAQAEIYPEEMVWGQQARLHRRHAEKDVGRWPRIPISPGRTYTVSCWVRLPSEFGGERVRVRIADWPVQSDRAADLGQGDVWQRIWSTGTAAADDYSWAWLEIDAPGGAAVVSTCWQFERSAVPTSYVATG